jgi:tetratricopeptide (TPR) repeat protein
MSNHFIQNKIKNYNITQYLSLFVLGMLFVFLCDTNVYAADSSSSETETIIPRRRITDILQKKELSPLQKESRLYRAQGLEQQNVGNIDDAMSYYQKAIETDPGYAVPYNDLGIIYEATGDMARAEDYYQKALTIDPNYVSAYSNLALLYEAKGDTEKAIVYWRERAKLGLPDDSWTQKAKARLEDFRQASPEFKQGVLEKERAKDRERKQREQEKEIVALNKMVAEQKKLKKQQELKQAETHLGLARNLYNKGEYNKALKELDLVLAFNPKEKSVLDLKDKIRFKIIEQEKRLKEEKKKRDIKNMQAHFETGVKYYQQDNLQQALEEFSKIEALITSPRKNK